MSPLTAPADELAALDVGRATVDLGAYRTVRVDGADARGWLHDLVTADVDSLRPGVARRSLLLDPTGHIVADLHVTCDPDGFWLFQAPDAGANVAAALAPYVLSSDVVLDDRTGLRRLVAFPGSEPVTGGFTPSVTGPGADLLLDHADDPVARHGRILVGHDAAEVWRIRRGRPRMGVDFDARSIPAETGLDETIDTTKGCFLGQESVARVRNLGHPPRIVLHLRSDAPVDRGTRVVTDVGDEAGVVSSAAAADGSGTVVLASIAWRAREEPLATADGSRLVPVGSLD